MEIPNRLVASKDWKAICAYLYLKKKFISRDGDAGIYVTSRELASELGIKSNSTANLIVRKLNDFGYLEALSESNGTFIQFNDECSR